MRPILRSRVAASLALGLLLCAAPSRGAAQQPDKSAPEPLAGATLPHAPERVYRAAFRVLREEGFVPRTRAVGELLDTEPRRATSEQQRRSGSAVPVYTIVSLSFTAAGDSTRLAIYAGSGTERDGPGHPEVSEAVAAGVLARVREALSVPEAVDTAGARLAAAGAYGWSRENPIRLGGAETRGEGGRRQRAYLSTLRSPAGEPVAFDRLGSCCPFPSKASPNGFGRLDVYEVVIPGRALPALLYFDLYETRPEETPDGFTRAVPGTTETVPGGGA